MSEKAVYIGSCPFPFKLVSPSEYVFKDGQNTFRIYYARGSWNVGIVQFVGGKKPWEASGTSGFKTKEDAAKSLKFVPDDE